MTRIQTLGNRELTSYNDLYTGIANSNSFTGTSFALIPPACIIFCAINAMSGSQEQRQTLVWHAKFEYIIRIQF
jgi:hypothetical protein